MHRHGGAIQDFQIMHTSLSMLTLHLLHTKLNFNNDIITFQTLRLQFSAYLTVHSDKPLAPTREDFVLTKLAQLKPNETKCTSHENENPFLHSIICSRDTTTVVRLIQTDHLLHLLAAVHMDMGGREGVVFLHVTLICCACDIDMIC